MNANNNIGLRSIATALPDHFVDLEDLRLQSEPATLRSFGFTGAWRGRDASALAEAAASESLANSKLGAHDIQALIWASALSGNHLRQSEQHDACKTLSGFCYQGSWLQEALHMENAEVLAVAQLGCVSLFSALRLARTLITAEPGMSHILCVGADVLPADAEREILYNVISDAACSCIVSNSEVEYRWLGYHQISKGYYWDVPASQHEIIASYYPTSAATIRGLLKKVSIAPTDIDLVIPTGINRSSWPILMRLCGIPEERLFEPQTRFGHTVSADSFLTLEQARTSGVLHPGMKLLLFSYGFGSSWTALLLETTELIAS